MTNNSGDKRIKEQVGNLQVTFDKEAAWMRLQDRLESKDEKKPYFRIAWAAAAMLLVATTLWYSFRDTQEVTVVKEIPEVVPVASEQPLNKPKAEKIVVSTAQPIKKEKKHRLLKQPKAVEPVQKVTPVPALVKEEPAPIPEPVTIVARPKPKMKTVHINEVIQEDDYERRMRNSRYAVERTFLSPKHEYEQAGYKLNLPNKKAELHNLNEEYRLLQN